MFGLGGNNEPSELQERILKAYDRNPDAGAKEIASMCNCSESHVRRTVKEYRNGFGGGAGLL